MKRDGERRSRKIGERLERGPNGVAGQVRKITNGTGIATTYPPTGGRADKPGKDES